MYDFFNMYGKDMFKHTQNDFLKICHGVTLTYERPIKNLGSLTMNWLMVLKMYYKHQNCYNFEVSLQ